MTPEEMAKVAALAIQDGSRMTLVRRTGKKLPPRFPRGELMCENSRNERVYSYDPLRILAWLGANGLIKVTVKKSEK